MRGCGGLTKRPLNNNRTSNNTSCGGRDSGDAIVVDNGRDSAEVADHALAGLRWGGKRMDVQKGSIEATHWYIDVWQGAAIPMRQAFAVTGVVSLGSTASPHDSHTSRASRRCPQSCSRTRGAPSSPARCLSPQRISVTITG